MTQYLVGKSFDNILFFYAHLSQYLFHTPQQVEPASLQHHVEGLHKRGNDQAQEEHDQCKSDESFQLVEHGELSMVVKHNQTSGRLQRGRKSVASGVKRFASLLK